MEKKGYKTLLEREAFYERKLHRAQQRSVAIIKEAHQEAHEHTETILAEGKKTLAHEQQLLAAQHDEALTLIQEQIDVRRKAIARKEKDLPALAAKIVDDLLKEWDAAA